MTVGCGWIVELWRVRPLLEELRQHQKTRGFADTALEDIEMFAQPA
jgi:hypothetical protein